MSRSRRAAREVSPPAPRAKRSIWFSGTGGLRTGWLLAASLAAWAALSVAGRWGLTRGFAALFEGWGLTAETLPRAPGWARWLYAWHGSLVTAAVSAALLAATRGLRRLAGLERAWPRPSAKGLLVPALAGLMGAAAVAAICLLPDSMRPTWPLTVPHLEPGLPILCAVSLLAALAEEALTKRVLYDAVRARGGRAWATAAAVLGLLLFGGMPKSPVSALNVALLGTLCCLIYERRGLWASVGLRWGWGVGCVFLLGNGGGDASVYRLYGVSETLMTGGDAGVMYGLWATLLFGAGIASMLCRDRRHGRKTRSAPETTRTSKGRSSRISPSI